MLCNANVYYMSIIVPCCSCQHIHTNTPPHHHTVTHTLIHIRHQRNAHLRDAANLKNIEDFKTAAAAAAREVKAESEKMKGEYLAHVGDLTAAIEMR